MSSTKVGPEERIINPELRSSFGKKKLYMPKTSSFLSITDGLFKKRPTWTLRALGKFKLRWDFLIMLISIWNCLSIPLDIAFEPPMFKSIINETFNHIIDAVFLIDIVINFRTTYIVEATGQELIDPRKIAIQYLKGRFIIDLFASVPFDSII
jgi:hypothetical protein